MINHLPDTPLLDPLIHSHSVTYEQRIVYEAEYRLQSVENDVGNIGISKSLGQLGTMLRGEQKEFFIQVS